MQHSTKNTTKIDLPLMIPKSTENSVETVKGSNILEDQNAKDAAKHPYCCVCKLENSYIKIWWEIYPSE